MDLCLQHGNIRLKCTVSLPRVVPATGIPLGELPPALAGRFCNVPTTVFAVIMSLAVSGGHLQRGANFATNRMWPIVAGTSVHVIITTVCQVSGM